MTIPVENWKHKILQKSREKDNQESDIESLKIIAINLFGQGITITQVAIITGLSVSEIEELKNKVTN